MRSLVRIVLGTFLILCLASMPLQAASYHGVHVGQRDDFIPPEFERVAMGEYRAQFDNELMQVFTEGALVTGFKVIPLAPMTLAEAIAAHSTGAVANDLQVILDFNRMPLGVADVAHRIVYFTYGFMPESIVRAVGYYSEQTEYMVLTAPLPDRYAADLAAAAARSTALALNRRPRIHGLYAQADYLVEEDTRTARKQGQQVLDQLAQYKRMCSGDKTTCGTEARRLADSIVSGAQTFFHDLHRAERTYNANAGLLYNPPEDLTLVQEMADKLTLQVREVIGPIQFGTPE
jgi:hypothetical protein